METTTVYLKHDYTATLCCPSCHAQRTVNVQAHDPRVATLPGVKQANVHCACGGHFRASFEWRRHPRFAVRFPGQLLHSESLRSLVDITVTSLSLNGLSFAQAAPLAVREGDIYTVRFRLAPAVRALVCAPVVCRRVTAELIGVECYAVAAPGLGAPVPTGAVLDGVIPVGPSLEPVGLSRRELRARDVR